MGFWGLWLSSETCFPAGKHSVSNSEMTAHRWASLMRNNETEHFKPLFFPLGQDLKFDTHQVNSISHNRLGFFFFFQLSYVGCVDISRVLRAIYSTYVTLTAFTTSTLKWHQSSSSWFPQSSRHPFIHPSTHPASQLLSTLLLHTLFWVSIENPGLNNKGDIR